ncbi:hypothetical protein K505DRAFT_333281 [Melanomma pulvis-pyrius CBS 109.77]|uniref:Ankyrin n=1 Tax=Melanomma pulvis-pyrius CBS 109.77 TaxID=1314802 RepID=A0A6A6XQX3_9PLEO|nr:hypothetical protein K505DRAFT_333281 [Melanomma pulvis-pyrius CBS 109.77]
MDGVSSVASILQITDLCARLGLGLYKLASNLKHLPADFRRKVRSVSELQQAVDSIGADLRQPSPCPIRDRLTDDALLQLLHLLNESHKEAVSLEHILDDALPQPDDNSFIRHRRTLRTMAKREDIQSRLDRLQELRSQLSICYGSITETAQITAQSGSLIHSLQGQVAAIASGANLSTQDRESISGLSTRFETLGSDLGARIGTAESSLGDGMGELRGDIIGRIGTVQTHINGVTHLIQSSTQNLGNQLQNGLDQMCSSFENYAAKQDVVELSEAANQKLADTIVARLTSTPSLLADSLAVTSHFQGPGICTCRRIGKQKFKRKFGPLTLYRRALGVHSPGCVYYGQESKTQLETRFSLLLTRLVSRSVEIQFGIRHGAGGFSISEGCGVISIVDGRNGPGFSRFMDAKMALAHIFHGSQLDSSSKPIREQITTEQVELALGTLLAKLWYMQEIVADIVNSIIQDLINGGVRTNATETQIEAHFTSYMMAWAKSAEHTAFSGCLRRLLSIEIVGRNHEEVKRLIKNEADVNDVEAAPYSPLCFTLGGPGWPIGMDILLSAGADPSSAIHCAIYYEDDVAVSMLLERGSSLFTPQKKSKSSFWDIPPRYNSSVLSYALWINRERGNFNHRILPLVVEALVRSRQGLMQLARKHISIPTLKRLGWKDPEDNSKLLDSAAKAVVSELQTQNIRIPDFMQPGPDATVYHNPWMTADVAEALFRAGFEEIDILDCHGVSPMLLNCHQHEAGRWNLPREIIPWLLTHGAKHVVFSSFLNISIVQKLAGNFSNISMDRDKREYTVQQTEQILTMLLGSFPLIDHRDSCTCFCGVKGCTPIQTMFRSYPWLLRLWNRCVHSKRLDYSNHREACRFELFSRLGMRHTCAFFTSQESCDFNEKNHFVHYLAHESIIPSQEEIIEIQDEDRSLKFQLDAFMDLYMELENQFIGDFELFWEAWWEMMQHVIPMEVWTANNRVDSEKLQASVLPIHDDELEGKLGEVRQGVMSSIHINLEVVATLEKLLKSMIEAILATAGSSDPVV